ncbi:MULTISPECIES: DUF421 domain-containing protein [Paenibacillus]|uniref:YetF C-terminal domain-containing protein n=2 Tax=Paenibacillus lactis TaxID=228574 RepID=G4HQ04_9BACL|nr:MULTISPECIES: DUF421 domain-containing protein [Paenibacillus]EHB46483.1 protein of unknown function DUF421 [Paenibacillus lactis 154]MBP1896104.1 uncharacterized membrane protein YcaP (DUF421 family) [Paenibacillus lactis]MCM3496576.1 DUF421 domain-containing protein [Paenibacillus lactis]GIO94245.1 DUF421 domain-containing protein [Paenibacillus lactis]HAF99936.1 DUF421 domain-containing protein [Paenibacillus lactis]
MNELWNEIWKSLVLIIFGMLVLRISGRKSISQMTVPTTITMISIGTIIVQPIAEENLVLTFAAALVFILVLILVEFMQVRWSRFERWIKGPAIIVIQDGQLELQNMKKLRLTVDALEMKLRQQGISKRSDVKTATIEPNGLLGYELQDSAKPVTLSQLEDLLSQYFTGAGTGHPAVEPKPSDPEVNLFSEIKIGDEHVNKKRLQ